jgi:hypothetical protein
MKKNNKIGKKLIKIAEELYDGSYATKIRKKNENCW